MNTDSLADLDRELTAITDAQAEVREEVAAEVHRLAEAAADLMVDSFVEGVPMVASYYQGAYHALQFLEGKRESDTHKLLQILVERYQATGGMGVVVPATEDATDG